MLLQLIIFFVSSFNVVNGQLNKLLVNVPGGSSCVTKGVAAAAGSGFRLTLQACSGPTTDTNQQFLFDKDGRLTLTIASTLYCVSDSVSSSTSTTASVADLVPCSSGTNLFQRWNLVRSGIDIQLNNQGNTGKCLDTQNSQTGNGQVLYVNPCSSTASTQLWKRFFLCNAGEQPNVAVDGCELCPTNFYKVNQAYVPCSPCVFGASCPFRDRYPTCDAGYKFVTNGENCETCKLFTDWKPLSGNRQCSVCPDDNGLVCGTTSTLTCNAGYEWQTIGTNCKRCDLGKYKTSRGNSTCRDCLIGTESNSGRTNCQDCSSGFYRDTLSMPQCMPCPTDSKCQTTCYDCYPGYGHNETSKRCDICDNRHYKPSIGNTACLPCPANQYSNANRTSCSATCLPGPCVDFGISLRHNAVILGDYIGSSDVQGSIAVGGNAIFQDGYSVADQINITSRFVNQTCDKYNVIVQKTLTWNSGRLYSGSIAVGQTSFVNKDVVVPECRVDIKSDAFDFDLAKNRLQNISSLFGNRNSTVVSKSLDDAGVLNITFSGSAIEILELGALDLGTKIKYIGTITGVKNGSLIVVNVNGTSAAIKMMNMESFAGYSVLFNFPQATELEVNHIAVRGGILAPYAVSVNSTGVIWGPVYMKSLKGPIQINFRPLICNCSTVAFNSTDFDSFPYQFNPFNPNSNFNFGNNVNYGSGTGGGGSGGGMSGGTIGNSTTRRSNSTTDPTFKQQSAESAHSFVVSLEFIIFLVSLILLII